MATDRGLLRVLVIDDERPALDELAFLLERDPRVGGVLTSDSATEALRILQDLDVDAVFLDIQMPGLSGLDLAQVLARFRKPPPVVFVTAHEEHAVEAFDLHAVDYVLKPVREDRLAEAVRRVVEERAGTRRRNGDEQIPVERGGVTRFVSRSDITHVEAHGDYARLHTADRLPPGAHPAVDAGGGVGARRLRPDPPLAARLAGPRRRGPDGRRSVHGLVGRHRAGGQPAAHPRAARPADPRRDGLVNRTRAERVRVTGPTRRAAGGTRTREIDAETRVGAIYMGSLLGEQLRLALRILATCSSPSACLPLLFHLFPGSATSGCSAYPWPGCCSASSSTRTCCSSAGATYAGPRPTSATSPTSSRRVER